MLPKASKKSQWNWYLFCLCFWYLFFLSHWIRIIASKKPMHQRPSQCHPGDRAPIFSQLLPRGTWDVHHPKKSRQTAFWAASLRLGKKWYDVHFKPIYSSSKISLQRAHFEPLQKIRSCLYMMLKTCYSWWFQLQPNFCSQIFVASKNPRHISDWRAADFVVGAQFSEGLCGVVHSMDFCWVRFKLTCNTRSSPYPVWVFSSCWWLNKKKGQKCHYLPEFLAPFLVV